MTSSPTRPTCCGHPHADVRNKSCVNGDFPVQLAIRARHARLVTDICILTRILEDATRKTCTVEFQLNKITSAVSHPALPVLPSSLVADDVLEYRVFTGGGRQRQLTVMLLKELLQLYITSRVHSQTAENNVRSLLFTFFRPDARIHYDKPMT